MPRRKGQPSHRPSTTLSTSSLAPAQPSNPSNPEYLYCPRDYITPDHVKRYLYPSYIHASPRPSSKPSSKAVLFQVPLPPDIPSRPLPPVQPDYHSFFKARLHAFGTDSYSIHDDFTLNKHEIATCDDQTAVLVKHWQLGAKVSGGTIVINGPQFTKFRHILQTHADDFAENDHLLTISLLSRTGTTPVRTFEFDMQGASTPLFLTSLIQHHQLSLHWLPIQNVVQFVFDIPDRALPSARAKTLSRVLTWLANFVAGGIRAAPRERYGKEWVYRVVRRLPDDEDACEYEPYLRKVAENRELNVTLRPYQIRAVAWMMSRECDEPLHLYRDVVWKDAKVFAEHCPLRRYGHVSVLGEVAVNLLEGEVKKYTADQENLRVGDCQGGLLCDEMGLGKTVELMQLVLCNKLEDDVVWVYAEGTGRGRGRFVCQGCLLPIFQNSTRVVSCLECERVRHKSCLGGLEVAANKYGYVCPVCCERMQYLSKEDTAPSQLPMSKATVVIIPTTLLLQWQAEIQKHCKDALKVEVFQGLRKSGYISHKRLMEADVVLTTYDALKADVAAFTALRKPRSGLRNPPKFRPTPIPLLTLRWHRLALDESQMLGSAGVSQAAKMASYMHATYRWCVTGTPLSYSVCNAVPMLDMLRIQGGKHYMNWSAFFSPSFFAENECAVRYALRKLMWRSSKADVLGEELKIPPQTIEEVRTRFGPVEKYHYNSLQRSVHQATMRYTGDDRRGQTVSNDLLTMLRQACCHPQIGISGRRLMSRVARQALVQTLPKMRNEDALKMASNRAENPLDMNEVLDALITKAKVECEEALRSLVASSNGLAAICWLQHSVLSPRSASVDGLVGAVRLYRQTLSLCEENKNVVRLDNIQKMHLLFNLNEALASVSSTRERIAALPESVSGRLSGLGELSKIGNTIRDANLEKELEVLRHRYLAEAEAVLVAATASYNELFNDLGLQPLYVHDPEDDPSVEDEPALSSPSTTKPKRKNRPWWIVAVAAVLEQEESKQESFLNRTVQRLVNQSAGPEVDLGSLANRLSSVLTFPTVIESELAKLQKSRDRLRSTLLKLPGSVRPTQAQVAESGQCRQCREFGRGLACQHCRSEGLFVDVERRLYCLRETEETIGMMVDEEERWDRESESGDVPANPQAVVKDVFNPKGNGFRPAMQPGGRFQSEVEIILKSLATLLRAKKDPIYNKQIADWFARFENMKKEHAEAKKLFDAQRSLLARMDEVNMAVMRISVVEEGENYDALSIEEKRHRIPKGSLCTLNVQFSNEKAQAEADFRAKRGSLVYLYSLQKTTKGENDCEAALSGEGRKIRQCPVCLMEFDDTVSRIAVMACGHVFCCDCTLALIRRSDVRARISNVSCPSCRVRCPVEEISFTINRPRTDMKEEAIEQEEGGKSKERSDSDGTYEEDEIRPVASKKRNRTNPNDSIRKMRRVSERPSTFYAPDAEVKGLIGAKASAVVRTLVGIWKKNAGAKVLIFSEWMEVLSLLSKALDMNGIAYVDAAMGKTSMQFANVVNAFKTESSLNVLLLPLRRAGAGLNLTEARHVILMEPSMNVALEAQAVGRVHRIGQDKETYVHRILVNNTIEDKILSLGDSYRIDGQKYEQATIKLADVLDFIHSGQVADEVIDLSDGQTTFVDVDE